MKIYETKSEILLEKELMKMILKNDEKYIKIKFVSDDDLPLKKTLELHNMVMFVRSVFLEDNMYYPQVFLDECLYKL